MVLDGIGTCKISIGCAVYLTFEVNNVIIFKKREKNIMFIYSLFYLVINVWVIN